MTRVSSSPPPAESQSEVVTDAQLPLAVEQRLNAIGVNGNAVLRVKSDLDAEGAWGERYLVATEGRVIVLAVKGVPANGDAAKSIDENPFKLAKLGAKGNLDVARSITPDQVEIELDVPLSEILKAESKGLVGVSSLEVRVRSGENGHTQEKVVELLRASTAHSRDISRAARQIEHLREHGAISEDRSRDEVRPQCANCGRPLPFDSKVCQFCINRFQALKRIFTYILPYKGIAITNSLLSVVGIALGFVSPVLISLMVDGIFKNPAGTGLQNPELYGLLARDVLLIVLAGLIGAGATILQGRGVAYLGAYVLADLRSQLYSHLQRLSLAYYDKREVGSVMSRVQNDVGQIQNFLLDGAQSIILSSLTIVCVLTIMFVRSPVLAVAVLIPVPVVVLSTNWYWRGLMKLWRRVWHQNSVLGARLADSLGGVRVVRAFAQEDREVKRFGAKTSELRDATMRVEQKSATFYPMLGFVMGLGAPIVWYLGGRNVLDGHLTLGGLILFTVLLQRLYEPIQTLTRMVNTLTRAMTAAERVFEVLDTEPEILERPKAVAMPHLNGHVEFRDVVFGYEKTRPVLKGVNLEVQPGEMIGLVGHSGAGKSTLINLIMRFYDVTEGAILVDGVDLRDIKRNDVRSQIGVVLQEPYLFHGSIYDNITYAKPSATPEEVMTAARAAYAHDFIVGFPDGYDTLVGERGTRLSGGERQRISIARAILHDPRILILDEATASVDTETESQIQRALQNLIKGRTTFAIAHRLSTLRNADRLIVLEDGKVAEVGTHEELLKKHGTFYKLVNMQQSINEIVAIGG